MLKKVFICWPNEGKVLWYPDIQYILKNSLLTKGYIMYYCTISLGNTVFITKNNIKCYEIGIMQNLFKSTTLKGTIT